MQRVRAPVTPSSAAILAASLMASPSACTRWDCLVPEGEAPDFAQQLGCESDYEALASEPTDASIPGATSVKTVVDRVDENALYFQNSKRFCIHWDFATAHLSGNGLPMVPPLFQFNMTEYYSPARRFLLGALSRYEEPGVWVYEISPYDTADADMIATAYHIVAENTWVGDELYFHPLGGAVEAVAETLSDDIPVIRTDELYEGIDYQPLNLGTTTGLLTFHAADEVDGTYTPFRELVVLDDVPNDISIVAGIVTSAFQTPLSHVNVLSVNRGTPNMALRGAQDRPEIAALEGRWVELTVGAFDFGIREITEAEADAWWEAHKPAPLAIQPLDATVTDLRDTSELLDLESRTLPEALSAAIPVFGAKAAQYGGIVEASEGGSPVPVQPGFAVPMFYYDQFMEENGLWTRIQELMASPAWGDPVSRTTALEAFRAEMRAKPVRQDVVDAVVGRAAAVFPGEDIRFRSSTNAEDLGSFTGAGLYDSETGHPEIQGDVPDSVPWAMKKVWSQVWNPRAYEEREYYSMDHLAVGMAMLVTANFPDEEANGVAITNNPYDTTGLEPALYVNGQEGEQDVVSPDPGVTADAYLHYYYSPGQPIVYLQHSSLVPEGETVLTVAESHELAVALDAVHTFFRAAYGDREWYAMDVEWKFDDKVTPGTPTVWIKQARPFNGWKTDASGACGER